MIGLFFGIVIGVIIGILYLYKMITYDDYQKLKEIDVEELEKIMDEFLNQVHSDRGDKDKFESLKADCVSHYNIIKVFLNRDFNKEIDDKFSLNLKSFFVRKNK